MTIKYRDRYFGDPDAKASFGVRDAGSDHENAG